MSEVLQFPGAPQLVTVTLDVSSFAVVPMWRVRRILYARASGSSSVRVIAFALRAAASELLHDDLHPKPDGRRWMGVSAAHARDRVIELLELAAELEEREEQRARSEPAP